MAIPCSLLAVVAYTLFFLSQNSSAAGQANTCSAPMRGQFNYVALKKAIIARKIKRFDEILPCLPQEHLEHFTLMYASRSAQKECIDPENPRVILYGKDARTIVAFPSNPKTAKCDSVEILELNEKANSFEFNRINFSQEKIHFKENPSLCFQCHGTDPKPIWDSYPLWPGAYGSASSSIGLSQDEENNYKSALRKQSSNRLKYLRLDDRLNDVQNVKLSILLYVMNGRRIYRLMKESPKFQSKRWQVLSTLFGCQGDLKEVSDNVSADVKAKKDILLRQKADRIKRDQITAKRRSPVDTEFLVSDSSFAQEVVMFDKIGKLLGIPTDNWFTSLTPGEVLLAAGATPHDWNTIFSNVMDGIFKAAIADIEGDIPNSTEYFRTKKTSLTAAPDFNYDYTDLKALQKVCATIALKSANNADCVDCQTTGNFGRPEVPVPSLNGITNRVMLTPFQKCVDCHSGAAPLGPLIPFQEENTFKAKLRDKGYKHGTLKMEILFRTCPQAKDPMPPHSSPLERKILHNEILRYFGLSEKTDPCK